jgi:hypothetical protein
MIKVDPRRDLPVESLSYVYCGAGTVPISIAFRRGHEKGREDLED